MMAELRLDVSGEAVARRYAGLIDGFVIDQADPLPESLQDITFFSAATLMTTTDDRVRLADTVLQAADTLRATQA
jgi:LPPG:FO 2-phospho-L-lactate transferase